MAFAISKKGCVVGVNEFYGTDFHCVIHTDNWLCDLFFTLNWQRQAPDSFSFIGGANRSQHCRSVCSSQPARLQCLRYTIVLPVAVRVLRCRSLVDCRIHRLEPSTDASPSLRSAQISKSD